MYPQAKRAPPAVSVNVSSSVSKAPPKVVAAAQGKGAFNSPKPRTGKTASVFGAGAAPTPTSAGGAGASGQSYTFAAPGTPSSAAGSTVSRAGTAQGSVYAAAPSPAASPVASVQQRRPASGTTASSASTSVYAEPDSPIASIKRGPLRVAAGAAQGAAGTARSPTAAGGAAAGGVVRPAVGSPTAAGATAAAAAAAANAAGGRRIVPGVAAPAPQASAGSNPNLFSPAYEDRSLPGQSTGYGRSAIANAAASASAAVAAAMEAASGLPSSPSPSGTPSPVSEQKMTVHSYSPPCMRPVGRAFSKVTASKEIYLRDLVGADGDDMDDRIFEEEEYDPFIFIKHLPVLESVVTLPRKSPIPRKAGDAPNITLALDLDETLVHCSIQPIENPELTFNVNFNGSNFELYVRIRPHLDYFLRTVSQWFEVVVFTASQKVYADTLLNILDPKNEFIQHRVFRDSCVFVEGNYLKDLNILGRPLDKVCIVDNSFQAFGFQLDNGIPIESWFDDDQDCELLNLLTFLRHLKDVSDVRPYIKQTFRLQDFVDSLRL